MNTTEILNIRNRFKEAGASGNKAHVVASQGKWILLRDGSPKAVATLNTKADALEEVKKMIGTGNIDRIVIHRPDGSVEKVLVINSK
ncbi:DUF2188 domain-containing protein [Aquiflexum sp.]|uniref:DUF2188 domain-containing protein n=1 Tax=Aquiflexum sp. TaxID=1872584 RepID=UPI003593D5FF